MVVLCLGKQESKTRRKHQCVKIQLLCIKYFIRDTLVPFPMTDHQSTTAVRFNIDYDSSLVTLLTSPEPLSPRLGELGWIGQIITEHAPRWMGLCIRNVSIHINATKGSTTEYAIFGCVYHGRLDFN